MRRTARSADRFATLSAFPSGRQLTTIIGRRRHGRRRCGLAAAAVLCSLHSGEVRECVNRRFASPSRRVIRHTMKRVVILTGSDLRHDFVRKYLANVVGIEVVRTYCEGREGDLRAVVERSAVEGDVRLNHLAARDRAEADFFCLYVASTVDRSHPVRLPKGEINQPAYFDEIRSLAPDLLIAYGCSIIREPLLSAFQGRFLNVHLGLSPYYRGGGTNYWPLVNGEPEYVGATFMHLDAGIDTGEIIHQIRAEYAWGDTPSQIGNRLILNMARVYGKVIVNFDRLKRMPQPAQPERVRVYRKRDYTEESAATLYRKFADGLIETYLREEPARCARVPLVVNPHVEPPQ